MPGKLPQRMLYLQRQLFRSSLVFRNRESTELSCRDVVHCCTQKSSKLPKTLGTLRSFPLEAFGEVQSHLSMRADLKVETERVSHLVTGHTSETPHCIYITECTHEEKNPSHNSEAYKTQGGFLICHEGIQQQEKTEQIQCGTFMCT